MIEELIETTPQKRYKFLRLHEGVLCSHVRRQCVWRIGETKHVDPPVMVGAHGFHCSQKILDARSYVPGEVLAEVSISGRGQSVLSIDQEVWETMTVVRAWYWGKREDVMVALYAARLALPSYEAVYPEDRRPQETIQAIQMWLAQPTDANASEVAVCRNALIGASYSISVSASRLEEGEPWRSIWAAESALWAVICAAASVIYPEADAEDAVPGETSPDMREDAIRWANATALRAAKANVNYTFEELGAITRQMYRKMEEWVQSSLLSQLRPYTD